MKYLITIGLLALASCTQIESESPAQDRDGYTIITIEGCEYIKVDHGISQGRIYSLTHKGNCKNHSR